MDHGRWLLSWTVPVREKRPCIYKQLPCTKRCYGWFICLYNILYNHRVHWSKAGIYIGTIILSKDLIQIFLAFIFTQTHCVYVYMFCKILSSVCLYLYFFFGEWNKYLFIRLNIIFTFLSVRVFYSFFWFSDVVHY